MRHVLTVLIVLLFFAACEKDTSIGFETFDLESITCEGCAKVKIRVPKALGNTKIDKVINTSLREEVISILQYDDGIEVSSMESALASFESAYMEIREKFPEEATPWEAKVMGEVSFENKDLLTIRLEHYLFTGGAHGYNGLRYLNFDKTQGKEIGSTELFRDLDGFRAVAESQFRTQEEIPPGTSINSTGFMFEDDTFYLPENIGLTKDGLQLYYEQYEVASYADGPIILNFPYQEIQDYMLPSVY